MTPQGSTFVVYDAPAGVESKGRDALLRKLRQVGLTDQRAISHNNGWGAMDGRIWPHRYADAVLDLFRVYGFTTLWDNLNCKALPWHGERWVDPETKLDDRTQAYSEPLFRQFLEAYFRYMAVPGLRYCPTWGNEPDAFPDKPEDNPFLNDEPEFRARFRVVCEVVLKLRADPNFKGAIELGAGGWVMDWPRAAAFVAWAEGEGLPLDFVEIHTYIDPDRVRQAAEAIRAVSQRVRIVIGESGAEWDHRIKPPSAAKQRAWYRGMQAAVDMHRIDRWLVMHGAAGTAAQALAVLGPRGGPTPIGALMQLPGP